MALHLPAHILQDAPTSPILNITFGSKSASTFATATTDGWVVYGVEPLRVISRRDFPNSSLKFVLPLAESNILFLVGGPPSPLYPPNKVLFWDDQLGKTVAELEFREDVRGLAARRDRLVVVLRRRVLIFVLGKGGMGVWREGVYETTDNPTGVVALATEEGSTLLAFPGRQPGQVQLVRLPPLDSSTPPLLPPPSHDPTTTPFPSVSILLAHTTSLSALSTTPSGSLLATASSKGTLVRIWDPSSSHMVKELRRGSDSAEIFGIAFSRDGDKLCVSSDKGTVHVWDLSTTREERKRKVAAEAERTESSRQKQFDILKPYLPKYFSSEWSHSQFRLPPPAPPASRLPFSLSNPGGGVTTGGGAGGGGSSGGSFDSPGRSTPTIEDDVCVCAWVEVEVEVPLEGTSGSGGGPTEPKRSDSSVSGSGWKVKSKDLGDSHVGFGSGFIAPGGEKENRRSFSASSTTTSASASTAASAFAPHRRTASSSNPRANSPVKSSPIVSDSSATTTTAAVGRSTKTRKESQIIALTHSGGWYRISLGSEPPPSPSSGGGAGGGGNSSSAGRGGGGGGSGVPGTPSFGLGKDSTSDCRLVEFRRFGSKDGW